jgi:thiol-disulfide isomerase/thioredoxin
MSSYPPTSPATIISTGSVTIISARRPGQLADSVFELADDEKSAQSIWDWDQNNFTDAAHAEAKRYALAHPQPKIYDESADGSKQIAAALATAREENKHVLLEFGANWCGPCHVLHTFFATDPKVSEELKRDYVIVMVDVNKGHNQATNKKYGNPTHFGLPALVILDSADKPLITQNTGELGQGDSYDSEKVMAFLKQWSSGAF